MSEETKIVYYLENEQTPYVSKINLAPNSITLGDFKAAIKKSNFKFFFKSTDADFGVVKEEVTNDASRLPLCDNRIVAWLKDPELDTISQCSGTSGVSAAGDKPQPRVASINTLSTIQSPIFEGVNGKLPTNVPEKKLKSENNPVHKPPSNKQNIRKKPKKSLNDNKFTYQSIEEAVKNEEIFTKIEEDLTGLKETFPNNEITWLKEIAAKLNTRLSCPETTFTEQDFDFPINKANKNNHVILSKTFGKNVSKEVVRLIFQHYLTTMLEYMGRDMPSWGYRICLQAITHSHPTICSKNLEKHLEKMKTYANDVKRCRALLWAVGQVGLKDMRCGLKVWLHLHLPNLDMKKLAPYSMSYIERIMTKCQRNPEQFLSDCLLPKHFVKITKLVKGNFPMKDRMQKIYPTFHHLITHNSIAKREFFTYLIKFSSADEEVTNQLVKIGVTCLQEDPHCFAIWREHYSENTLQISKLLLEEMLERQPSVNSDAASKSNVLASKLEFPSVRSACEKMNIDSKSKYFYLTMLLLVLCGSLLYYDVTSHGSWATSATHKFLDSNGVLKFMEQIILFYI